MNFMKRLGAYIYFLFEKQPKFFNFTSFPWSSIPVKTGALSPIFSITLLLIFFPKTKKNIIK